MKRMIWMFAGCLACGAPAQADMLTGTELAKYGAAYERNMEDRDQPGDAALASYFIGYIYGVRDMGLGIKTLCIPPGKQISGEQQAQTVKVYLDQHPQVWDESAVTLTFLALKQLFPCSQ